MFLAVFLKSTDVILQANADCPTGLKSSLCFKKIAEIEWMSQLTEVFGKF